MTHTFRHASFHLAVLSVFAVGVLRADDSAPASRRITPLVLATERAMEACVDIDTEKSQKSLDVVFPTSKSSKVNGMGTGIVIDERGYIVTNYHVVDGVDKLMVTLQDGSKYDARVINSDVHRDLSIIYISAVRPLKVMPLGTSSDLKLGEEVLAIGNAFGYKHSVTRGIISALGRNVEVNEEQGYENLIQTDAAINPGNSGGPLLNADGELIGINVAIRQGAQKIGFTIPIDDARKVVAQLMSIEKTERTWHGVEATDFKQGSDRKLIVRSVQPNSPAAAAGLQPGDVVVRAKNVDVIDGVDLERSMLGMRIGQDVPVVVQRDGEEKTLTLQLAAAPTDRFRATRNLVATTQSQPQQRVSAAGGDKAWRLLGLKLEPLPNGDGMLNGQPFKGGMKVTDVRAQSPAEQNGIRAGDILVGLHVWETVSDENVKYVLDLPNLSSFSPLKFYILRDGDTLFGHFTTTTASR